MHQEVETLLKKKQITESYATNAKAGIKFYAEHVKILPFQESAVPILRELVAIDYSFPVKAIRVKEGRVLTQMQAQDSHNAIGSFYAEGSLPSDFDKRASMSGIGSKSLVDNDKVVDKSVYQTKVTKPSIFLRSIVDTWSINEQPQKASGKGAQWRVSTEDYHNIKRPEFYSELSK